MIDRHNRELVGVEFAVAGVPRRPGGASEEAWVNRVGTPRLTGPPRGVGNDDGVIFHPRRFRGSCKDKRVRHACNTPSPPERNGLIERFVRTFTETCLWQHAVVSFPEARRERLSWIASSTTRRPQAALGTQSPAGLCATHKEGGVTRGEHNEGGEPALALNGCTKRSAVAAAGPFRRASSRSLP